MKNLNFLLTIIFSFFLGSILGQGIKEIPGLPGVSEVPHSPGGPNRPGTWTNPIAPADPVNPITPTQPAASIVPSIKVGAPPAVPVAVKSPGIVMPKKANYDTVPFSFEALPTYIKKDGRLVFRPRVTYVNLNYFAGRTHKLHGAGWGIIGQWAQEEVIGAQFSNIFNFSGGKVTGAQFTTISNFARGDLKGAQLTTISNIAGGNIVGAQFSTVSNLAGGKLTGTQFSTVSNVALKKVKGAQAAVVSNVALGNFEGVQASVISNVVSKRMDGAQVSVLFNYAKESRGVQVGFVNIAQESRGIPIGFLNLSKNGQIHPELWTDELGLTHLSLKTGNKNFYGMINFAAKASDDLNKEGVLGFGLGWGAKVPFRKVFLSSDLSSNVYLAGPKMWENRPTSNTRLRVGGGFQPYGHLGLTAGLSLTGQFHGDEGSANLTQDFSQNRTIGNGRHQLSYWPGFYAGVNF